MAVMGPKVKKEVSQKSGNYGSDLIQNCDLPPPIKLFSGSYHDSSAVISCFTDRKKAWTLMSNNQDDTDDKDGKMGLLKALRLSQTRAREAQAKCQAIAKERDTLAFAYIEDSMQVFAYRQLVRLLQLQVSILLQKKKMQVMQEAEMEDGSGSGSGSGNGGLKWIMAVAFCLGIAGFGFWVGA